jgi:hypothetical protein
MEAFLTNGEEEGLDMFLLKVLCDAASFLELVW